MPSIGPPIDFQPYPIQPYPNPPGEDTPVPYVPPPLPMPNPGMDYRTYPQLQEYKTGKYGVYQIGSNRAIWDPLRGRYIFSGDPTYRQRFRGLQRQQSRYANPFFDKPDTAFGPVWGGAGVVPPTEDENRALFSLFTEFGSPSQRRFLQNQFNRLYSGYGALAANAPAGYSWLDFLRNLNLEGLAAAATPYERGENPTAFEGRLRRVL